MGYPITLDQEYKRAQAIYDLQLPPESERPTVFEAVERELNNNQNGALSYTDFIAEVVIHDRPLIVEKSIRLVVDWLNRNYEEIKDGKKSAFSFALNLEELFELCGTKDQVKNLYDKIIKDAIDNDSPLIEEYK